MKTTLVLRLGSAQGTEQTTTAGKITAVGGITSYNHRQQVLMILHGGWGTTAKATDSALAIGSMQPRKAEILRLVVTAVQ